MNEEQKNESGQETVNNSEDYIKALKEMKERTVPKEQYDKVKEENKQLLQTLIEGGSIPQDQEENPVDLKELRKELFSRESDLTNIEFTEKMLKLRKEVINQGGRDPFLPIGDHVRLTPDQIESASRTADVLEECVEMARGDSGVFTAELQRRTKDVMPKYGKY